MLRWSRNKSQLVRSGALWGLAVLAVFALTRCMLAAGNDSGIRLVQGSSLWLVAAMTRKSESFLEVDQVVQEAPPCLTNNTDFI